MTIEIFAREVEGYQRIFLKTNEIDRVDHMLRWEYDDDEALMVEWDSVLEGIEDTPEHGVLRHREVDITKEWLRLVRLFRDVNARELAEVLERLIDELFGKHEHHHPGHHHDDKEAVRGYINFTVPEVKPLTRAQRRALLAKKA